MLIDLYKDYDVSKNLNQRIGLVKKRLCTVEADLSYYNNEVACSSDTDFHIKSVLETFRVPRSYDDLYSNSCDSHNEVERLGVCKHAKKYTTIVSLEDSLDYVLHRLSKCSVMAVRSMSNYYDFSRSLLKLNLDFLEKFSVEHLLNLDENLDKYLVSLLYDEDGNEKSDEDYMLSFIKDVLNEVGRVVDYVGLYFKEAQPEKSCVTRSKSYCSHILSTDEKLDNVIIIRSEGFDDYQIRVRSFTRMEYFKNVDLRYVE